MEDLKLDAQRLFDKAWKLYEGAVDADVMSGGCPHSTDGSSLVCWSCREKHARQTLGALFTQVYRVNSLATLEKTIDGPSIPLRLRRVAGSMVLTVPAAAVRGAGLEEGDALVASWAPGRIEFVLALPIQS